MPCITFRNRGSREEFVEKFFWAKPVHNFIGHDVLIVTDVFSTFNQERDQLSLIFAFLIMQQA